MNNLLQGTRDLLRSFWKAGCAAQVACGKHSGRRNPGDGTITVNYSQSIHSLWLALPGINIYLKY